MSKKKKRAGGNPAKNPSRHTSSAGHPGAAPDGPAARLVELGLSEGVDFSDRAQVEAFMERFNAMPEQWRQQALPDEVLDRSQFTIEMPSSEDPFAGIDLDELDQHFELEQVMGFPDQLVPNDLTRSGEDFARHAHLLPWPSQPLRLRRWVQQLGELPVTNRLALKRADLDTAIGLLGLEGFDLMFAVGLTQPRMDHYPALARAWDFLLETDILGLLTQTKVFARPSGELDELADVLIGGRRCSDDQATLALQLLSMEAINRVGEALDIACGTAPEAAETLHFAAKTMLLLAMGSPLQMPSLMAEPPLSVAIFSLLHALSDLGLVTISADVVRARPEGIHPLAAIGLTLDPRQAGGA